MSSINEVENNFEDITVPLVNKKINTEPNTTKIKLLYCNSWRHSFGSSISFNISYLCWRK